jgi:transcriptional regulator with XRE-family HTH domain
MQFYENYVRLCNAEGKKPTAVAMEVGITRATASRWSRGMVPSYPNLLKLAEHFGVSVGELVGATPENVKDLAKYFSVSESLLLMADSAKKGKVESLGNAEEHILEVLRSSPGRRALFAATKNMTEEQVQRMADFAQSLRGDDD